MTIVIQTGRVRWISKLPVLASYLLALIGNSSIYKQYQFIKTAIKQDTKGYNLPMSRDL